MQIHFIYINVEPESKMKKDRRKPKTCVNQIGYFEIKLGFQKTSIEMTNMLIKTSLMHAIL